MTIAWQKLVDVPRDDPRPWLFATARNLLLTEWRRRVASSKADRAGAQQVPGAFEPTTGLRTLDPELATALRLLSDTDREALFLIAWEDLSPKLAARSVGLSSEAFRVRLHRARRRLQRELAGQDTNSPVHHLELEER